MADIAAIREALATKLATVTGVQTSAWLLRNPTVPSLQIMGVDEIEYDTAFQRGGDTITFTVQGFAGAAESIAGQKTLAGWLNTSGTAYVKGALEQDTTLGGTVDALRVVRYTGDKLFRHESLAEVVGGEWLVEVDVSN